MPGAQQSGFVEIGEQTVGPMGSGTLVQVGVVSGVLTCAHVLEKVLKRKEIGIVCFPAKNGRFQTFKVSLGNTDWLSFGTSQWTKDGPDLGFLKLPLLDMSSLGAIASIINGDKQRTNAKAGEPPDAQAHFDLVSGVIGDWMGEPIQTETTVMTPFNGLLNVGNVVEKYEAHGFDLIRFEAVPENGFELPKHYKGVSGGGLWRLYIKKEADGSFALVQARLAGVAFYETSDRHIVCHGRSSVYDHLFEAVASKWPSG